MNQLRPEAVLIDFYGTISSGDHEAVEMACRTVVEVCNLPVSPSDFALAWGLQFFQMIERSNHDSFRTLFECEAQSLRETLATHGVFTADHDLHALLGELEAYWANPPLYTDAVEFLRNLDLPVCCVSNADTAPLLSAIKRHGLRFNAVITSEEARCYKPCKEIFVKALEAMGVSPDRVVHIGDSRHSDVAGATQLGIKTIWVRRERRVMDIENGKPHFTITTLDELPSWGATLPDKLSFPAGFPLHGQFPSSII